MKKMNEQRNIGVFKDLKVVPMGDEPIWFLPVIPCCSVEYVPPRPFSCDKTESQSTGNTLATTLCIQYSRVGGRGGGEGSVGGGVQLEWAAIYTLTRANDAFKLDNWLSWTGNFVNSICMTGNKLKSVNFPRRNPPHEEWLFLSCCGGMGRRPHWSELSVCCTCLQLRPLKSLCNLIPSLPVVN